MNLKPHILEWLERGDDTALTPERAARSADIETIRLFEEQLQSTAVAVAQLVESRIVIPAVTGSSPVGHPKN